MSIILDAQDRRTPTADKLVRYYTERLAELREENDHPQSEMTTQPLRGRIAEIKRLLDLLATGEG